ncbi:alpha-N-acetylgalactosaminidase-like [Ylistrum balloti]|uniref:alpha-N-acetylgalactosaminidase-like n=1 Tax=Ylistrum balloti TaxID=509963 RepID=UPI002905DDF6|nr:alpha-N-acetylgalactosaminidase-like [Ylistrum balloti]
MAFQSVLIMLFLAPVVSCLDNGLALTPPMGWMQWERFRCNLDCKNDPENCISEKLIMEMADRMEKDGYRDAGYTYISLDDCWMSTKRDSQGILQPDKDRFPHGIKYLADYVHSKGLKLGIYLDMGLETCKGFPGSKFSIQRDALSLKEWGIDMLKMDCCEGGSDMVTGYEVMGFYLNQTGRRIAFSCSYPACIGDMFSDYAGVAKLCNSWRNAIDITDSWERVYEVMKFYSKDVYSFSKFAGPGHWNDPDEMIVGDYSLSDGQERSQFGMWAMFAAPLFMSVDLRNIKSSSRNLLLNKRVIDINQDPLGAQATNVWQRPWTDQGVVTGWVKPLMKKGSYAIALLNGSAYGMPAPINITLNDLGLNNEGGYNITETFEGKFLGPYKLREPILLKIHAHDTFLATVVPL